MVYFCFTHIKIKQFFFCAKVRLWLALCQLVSAVSANCGSLYESRGSDVAIHVPGQKIVVSIYLPVCVCNLSIYRDLLLLYRYIYCYLCLST